MGTAADIFQIAGATPVWLSVSLVVLALLGRGVLARVGSARRQGSRIGRLELLVQSERNRRRQVEAELIRLGVPLPYWPEDPLPIQLRRPPAPGRVDVDDLDDVDDVEPVTAAAPRIPVPPLPDGVGARHRREPARN